MSVCATSAPVASAPLKKWMLCEVPLSLLSSVSVSGWPATALSVDVSQAVFSAEIVRFVDGAAAVGDAPPAAVGAATAGRFCPHGSALSLPVIDGGSTGIGGLSTVAPAL